MFFMMNKEGKADEALEKLFKIVDDYNPERETKNGFCGFFRDAVEKLKRTTLKEENKEKEQVDKNLEDSVSNNADDIGEKQTQMAKIAIEEKGFDMLNGCWILDGCVDAVKIMLKKRNPNSSVTVWKKLFLTEFITRVLQEEPNKLSNHIIENEKRYTTAIDISFADSYLEGECKSLSNVPSLKLKLRKEFGIKRCANKKYCGYPLFGAVYEKYTGKTGVCKQRDQFSEVIYKMLQEKDII